MSSEVTAVIWTNYADPAGLHKLILENPQLRWVQLPFAGVDAFAAVIADPVIRQSGVVFTSAKGSYREPVAEHALALCLALGRKIRERVYAKSWGKKFAKSLYDSNVLIVGGGGITEELVKLLQPFRAKITVIRKHADRSIGGPEVAVLPFNQLDAAIPNADFIVLAAALTPETHGLFDARRIALMNKESYLVNIARGPMIDTEALVDADQAHGLGPVSQQLARHGAGHSHGFRQADVRVGQRSEKRAKEIARRDISGKRQLPCGRSAGIGALEGIGPSDKAAVGEVDGHVHAARAPGSGDDLVRTDRRAADRDHARVICRSLCRDLRHGRRRRRAIVGPHHLGRRFQPVEIRPEIACRSAPGAGGRCGGVLGRGRGAAG